MGATNTNTAPAVASTHLGGARVSERTCTAQGCHRSGRLKLGMCGMHYQRHAKELNPNQPARPRKGGECSVDGCLGMHARISLGMCMKHYQRFKLHGTTEDRPTSRWVICSHSACSLRARADGLCREHQGGANSDRGFSRHAARWEKAYCAFYRCGKPHKVNGLCQAHSQLADHPSKSRTACARVGCGDESFSRGLCVRHLYRRYVNLLQFNLTIDQYDHLLASQDFCCAICGGINPDGKMLAVDHDHHCCPEKAKSCGRCVRALLCATCNLMIGQSGDDAKRLRAAAAYLELSRS